MASAPAGAQCSPFVFRRFLALFFFSYGPFDPFIAYEGQTAGGRGDAIRLGALAWVFGGRLIRLAQSTADGSVRIHPWVSYVLGLLLLGGSLGILLTSPDGAAEASKSPAMLKARAFFERNPDVELSGRLARWIGLEHIAEVRAKHERRRQQGAIAVLSERMRDKTQKRFDAVQRAAFSSLENLPSWRFGVVNSSSPFRNTFVHGTVHESAMAVGVSIFFFVLAAITLEGAWGSLIFGVLCLLLPFVSTTTYTSLYGDQGIPWIGASGVIAGLLGAYLVRSFKGFTIPFWILLPVWVIGEYLLARDLPIDHYDPIPVVVHSVSFAFGAAFAALVWVSDLEEKLQLRQDDTPNLISNPVLEQALMESDHGNVDGAFQLLEAALRREPDNHDVAVALWQVSSGSDRARRAVPVLLSSIRDALRTGRAEDACSIWIGITLELGEPEAESTLLVRIAEALLSEEEHEAALRAFAKAVDGPKALSSVLALRVVRGARDLDPDLSARAAAVALVDDQLGGSERAILQAVLDGAAARSAPVSAAAKAAAEPIATAERTPQKEAAPEPDPLQDPHAIAAEVFSELGEGETLAKEDPEEWNQPGMVEDLSAELEDDDSSFDWSGLADDEEDAPAESDTSVDLDDSAASPLGPDASDISETTETLEPPTDESAGPTADPRSVRCDSLPADSLLAEKEESSRPEDVGRELLARAAVPVSLDDEGLSIEVDGGAKTVLPYARIEAVAAGAVSGLAEKPVLVVDVVLNWLAVANEPLKLVRLRSDGFDPRSIVPDEGSALESLRAMLDQLLSGSGATPLPDRSGALGDPFATFENIESYNRSVLKTR